MREIKYTIVDEHGIHARPAGELVKLMQGFECDITFIKGEKKANGKKLFAVMGMAVKKGEEITVCCDGADEEAALQTAEKFLSENL